MHPNSKLTDEQRRAIAVDTRPDAEIAREYGVSKTMATLCRRQFGIEKKGVMPKGGAYPIRTLTVDQWIEELRAKQQASR